MLRVVFRSEREVVVRKPAGVSSDAPGDAHEESALARVRRTEGWPEARLPHRLDRVTSGYLCVARDAASAAFHAASIRNGSWIKGYLARVAMGEGGVRLAELLGRHRRFVRREGRRAIVVRSGGDPAWMEILEARPAPRRPGEAHLAIRLLTGRYHQIRVMCADLGVPLVGDIVYGAAPGPLYLEHARFHAPSAGGGTIDLFEPQDPEREPVDPAVLGALAGIDGDPGAGANKAST